MGMNPSSLGCAVVLLSLLAGCRADLLDSEPGRPGAAAGDSDAAEWFTDRAAKTGLAFVHFNGMTGRHYLPEMMAPGVALVDVDNDGDLDVYLVQGRLLGEGTPLVSLPPGPLEGRLFRNDLERQPDGSLALRFTDVSAQSGLRTRGYGMGVATGDIDNDGWTDLYITGLGGNQMFRNNGNGTFSDVTESSGTGDPEGWGVSAAFLDYDRDGRLDLFVGNYLAYSIQTHFDCFDATGVPNYCGPATYRAQPDRLYRNLGGGRFASVSESAGVARAFGPALGVSTADFDGDGWIDIFVANDQQENQLWINQGDGTFHDAALLSGVALGASGEYNADMGVDAGDFDNDGDEDLFITEIAGQGSTLYVNDGTGLFEELSVARGIRRPSLPYTGFGAAWFDFDNDGWLDILAVNGAVNRVIQYIVPDDPLSLGQRNQLFRNVGGHFADVTDRGGSVLRLVETSRGAAFGDVDNDGDQDVLIMNSAGPVRLLINNLGNRHQWVGLRLVGRDAQRDMLGARVALVTASGSARWRRARADGSYGSAHDPRVLFGLGSAADAPVIRVQWPSGSIEEWESVAIDRYTTLVEGTGRPAARLAVVATGPLPTSRKAGPSRTTQ